MREELWNKLLEAWCTHFEKFLEEESNLVSPGVMSALEQQMDALFKGYQLIGEVGYSKAMYDEKERMKLAKEMAKSRGLNENVRLTPYIVRETCYNQDASFSELVVKTSAFYVYAKPLTPVEDADMEKGVEKVMETLETA